MLTSPRCRCVEAALPIRILHIGGMSPMTTTNTQIGLVGFLCEVTEEPVTFQECLACAQRGAPGCKMMPAIIHDTASSITGSKQVG